MTRAAHIHQARVYLAQARATRHRGWRFRLMEWAADRYRMAVANVPDIDPVADARPAPAVMAQESEPPRLPRACRSTRARHQKPTQTPQIDLF